MIGVRRVARRLLKAVKPRRPRPAILMYHRVVELPSDPWELAVSPALFEQQMAYLRQHRSPMSMQEIVERWQRKTLPADAVAVTFDDGYLDNLINAKPALVKHRVPATVFVATGFTGRDMPYWWDELAGMILDAGTAFERKIFVNGEAVSLQWGEREPSDGAADWRGWDTPRTARQRSYVDLWSRLQSADQAERTAVLLVLRQHLQAPPDPLGIAMTAAQLGELVAGSLVSLGGHTITHRALTDLEREVSRAEIEEGGKQCRSFVNVPLEGFAYPYGNFDAAVRDDVSRSSFAWACTTEPQFLDGNDVDRFALPRVAVTNAPLQTFALSIRG